MDFSSSLRYFSCLCGDLAVWTQQIPGAAPLKSLSGTSVQVIHHSLQNWVKPATIYSQRDWGQVPEVSLRSCPLWPLCSRASQWRDWHLLTENCTLQISANCDLMISANNGFVCSAWFSPSMWWILLPGEVALTALGLCCSEPHTPICTSKGAAGGHGREEVWAESIGERPGSWELNFLQPGHPALWGLWKGLFH